MTEYQNGKIYRIVCQTTGKIYIGSTIKPLNDRLSRHKYDYTNFLIGKRKWGCSSFEIINGDNYTIELIELFPCNSKFELYKREGEHQLKTECVNKNIAGRTDREYYQDNKLKILTELKSQYQDNKDAILERNSRYYQANKEAIAEQRKQYRQENKEKHDKQRKCYEEKMGQRIDCPCGGKTTLRSQKIHEQTAKHKTYLTR